MAATKQYEVWWSEGDGSHRGPQFATLVQALEYVTLRAGEASFAIRKPDQSWYRMADGTMVFSRWHERAA